jgi:hypothetical protein
MSELDVAALAHDLAAGVAQRAAAARALPGELRSLPAQAAARATALHAAIAGKSADQLGVATPEVAPSGPAPKGRRANLLALVAAEERAIATLYAAVQKIDDEQTLRVAARVMAGDGQSLALLRQAMNRSPVPSAFETGKAP